MSPSDQDFAVPAFHGGRFEGEIQPGDRPALPVGVLPELAVYEQLIVALAGEIYKEEHGAKNVPPNFSDSFQLQLTEIRKGSRVAAMKLAHAEHVPVHDFFARGRDEVDSIVAAVGQGNQPSRRLPPKVLQLFGQFGKRLQGDEVLELRRPGYARGVAYTPEVRQRFLRLAAQESVYPVSFTGPVVGVQSHPKRIFRLMTSEEGLIKVPFPAHLSQQIADAWRDHKFVRVTVEGLASFKNNKLQDFVDPPSVTLKSKLAEDHVRDVETRLREFETLEAGWADGAGGPLPKEGLGWLRGLLLEMMATYGLPLPVLVPMPEGGVKASWKFWPWYVTAEFDLSSRSAFIHAAQVETSQVEAIDVSFPEDEDEPLSRVTKFIKRFEPKKGQD